MDKADIIKLVSEFPRQEWTHYFEHTNQESGIMLRYYITDALCGLFGEDYCVKFINLGSRKELGYPNDIREWEFDNPDMVYKSHAQYFANKNYYVPINVIFNRENNTRYDFTDDYEVAVNYLRNEYKLEKEMLDKIYKNMGEK